MTKETEGIRLLRTLLSCKPEQLGHTIQKMIVSGKNSRNTSLSFQLKDTLGRGSFATVFSASLIGGESLVAIKTAIRTKIVQGRKHKRQLDHMINECKILRDLQSSSTTQSSFLSSYSTSRRSSSRHKDSDESSSSASFHNHNIRFHFPSLYDSEWKCTEAQPFLPFTPIGIPLVVYASQHDKATRVKLAKKLHDQLTKALEFVHSKEYCHRDLRPDNVIYDDTKKVFVIIDWGLGAKVNSPMHEYKGGIDFFHDRIIRYLFNKETEPLLYIPEFDVASATYVAYAFKLGNRHLLVPWQIERLIGEELIMNRNRCMMNA